MHIFGHDSGAYRIELTYDGVSYHYRIRLGCRVLHHFVAEFDDEHEARKWAAELCEEHLEQIANGVL